MPRAYLVTARTDLDNAQLLLYELRPDTMHRVPSMEPAGQTRYLPRVVADTPLQLTFAADGSATLAAGARGLAAWALDNIQNQDGGKSMALTDLQAATFSQKVRALVDGALPLTAASVNAALNTIAGVSKSVIGGDPASASTGSLTDLLQILSGSIYAVQIGRAHV